MVLGFRWVCFSKIRWMDEHRLKSKPVENKGVTQYIFYQIEGKHLCPIKDKRQVIIRTTSDEVEILEFECTLPKKLQIFGKHDSRTQICLQNKETPWICLSNEALTMMNFFTHLKGENLCCPLKSPHAVFTVWLFRFERHLILLVSSFNAKTWQSRTDHFRHNCQTPEAI